VVSKGARVAQRRAAAAAEVRRRDRERLRRQLWAAGAVGLVLAVIAVLVIIRMAGGGAASATQKSSDPDATRVTAAATSVPDSILDQVGAGKVDTPRSWPAASSSPTITCLAMTSREPAPCSIVCRD
jgi:hypothetical protein